MPRHPVLLERDAKGRPLDAIPLPTPLPVPAEYQALRWVCPGCRMLGTEITCLETAVVSSRVYSFNPTAHGEPRPS